MQLADEVFFVALDDRTGKPRLSPKVLALGLAGALLAELALEQRITVDGDRITVVDRHPPGDALAHTILQHLATERSAHPVRTWLVYLAKNSHEQVADRLWRAGQVRRVKQRRRLLVTETIYPPTDANVAYGPTARLTNDLRRGRLADWQEAALAGLVVATGLESHVLYANDHQGREYLRYIVEHLLPSLHALVWHVHAAVGDAVLTGRT